MVNEKNKQTFSPPRVGEVSNLAGAECTINSKRRRCGYKPHLPVSESFRYKSVVDRSVFAGVFLQFPPSYRR